MAYTQNEREEVEQLLLNTVREVAKADPSRSAYTYLSNKMFALIEALKIVRGF
jgi:hypothetical protein